MNHTQPSRRRLLPRTRRKRTTAPAVDFIAKERICLRELKETRVRLRILRGAGLLGEDGDALIAESDELVRIVATIIRNSGG